MAMTLAAVNRHLFRFTAVIVHFNIYRYQQRHIILAADAVRPELQTRGIL